MTPEEEKIIISATTPNGKIYSIAVLRDTHPGAVRDARKYLQKKIKDDIEPRITLMRGKDDDEITCLQKLGVKLNIV